jgi:hypothetical protein
VGGVDVLSLDTLCELCGHARVHLHRRAVLCLFQYFHGQVSRTWADFKDLIRGSEVGLDSQVRAASEDIDERDTFSTILGVPQPFNIS